MKIRTYKTKTYIDGWKLGQGFRGKTLVAIPENKLSSASEVEVKLNTQQYYFSWGAKRGERC